MTFKLALTKKLGLLVLCLLMGPSTSWAWGIGDPSGSNFEDGSGDSSSSARSSGDSGSYNSCDPSVQTCYGGGSGGSRGSGGSSWDHERGGGGRSGGHYGRYGALSYVGLGSNFPRGRGLQKARLTCPGSGSFQWMSALTRPPRCQAALGNAEFFEVLDRSFNKCVAAGARFAGISSSHGSFGGQVHHKGIMGDARHQQTRSLHNVGRAIDISTIVVNGQRMDFAKASQQKKSGQMGKEYKFFVAFRDCWSQEARTANSRCKGRRANRAGYFGSIGWEDRKHQNHLHVSLPICDQPGFYSSGLDPKLEILKQLLSVEPAQAAEMDKPDKIEVKTSSGDMIRGSATFIGEPVAEPVEVQMKIRCKGSEKDLVLEESFSACDYVSFKEDEASKKLMLTVSTSEFDEEEGTLRCGRHEERTYENPCLASSTKTEEKK